MLSPFHEKQPAGPHSRNTASARTEGAISQHRRIPQTDRGKYLGTVGVLCGTGLLPSSPPAKPTPTRRKTKRIHQPPQSPTPRPVRRPPRGCPFLDAVRFSLFSRLVFSVYCTFLLMHGPEHTNRRGENPTRLKVSRRRPHRLHACMGLTEGRKRMQAGDMVEAQGINPTGLMGLRE